jgi:hypothetical protein
MRPSTFELWVRLLASTLTVLGYIAWRTELFAHPMAASLPELGLSWILAAALVLLALHSAGELIVHWWERGTRVTASIVDESVAQHRLASPAEVTAMNAAVGHLSLPETHRKPGEELDAWLLAEAVTNPMGLTLLTHEYRPAGRAMPTRYWPETIPAPYGRHAAH